MLILFSAFFSSAETSFLAINKIRLNLKVKNKNKKALLIKKILNRPDEFFSTILIGNNFVNIAAATISTALVARILTASEELSILISTIVTTVIILFFAEIIPKSYAFRHSEKLSYIYAYPVKIFGYLLYPFIKFASVIPNLFFKKGKHGIKPKELTTEEIKHFLSSEAKLFRYSPESKRMVNEIIDIAEKDIKSIMTPRVNILALEDNSNMEELLQIIIKNKLSKIPIYKGNLDNIGGIIHTEHLIPLLIKNDYNKLSLTEISVNPIFISEYSSLLYALKEFKKHGQNFAIILDEYGATIGTLALNDIFREILGEIKIGHSPIKQISETQFIIKGNLPVEEVNTSLNIMLPEQKRDYTTLSGLFVYYFGKFPEENSRIKLKDLILGVKKMGRRKIEEIVLTIIPRKDE